MAHLAKFGGGIEGEKMYSHWSRETDADGHPMTYAREHGGAGHIDRNMTALNFTIGTIHDREWVKHRLKHVYQKPGQKRPVESCDIIVTLPQSEPRDEGNVRKFMQAAYDSLSRQYGKHDNIIGCWVHMDEAQPHMHFAFLPIGPRKSKQKPEYKEKLAVHDYWPRKNSLQVMHQRLQKDIDDAMGRHVEGINNGITKEQGGNKSITQLKAESMALQERMEKSAETDEQELKLLRGKRVKPLLGSERYELTPEQHRRLLWLAQLSVQAKREFEQMKSENERIERENTDLRRRMQRYYLEARAKAEEDAQDELAEARKEADISERSRFNAEREAAPWLSVPLALRGKAREYLSLARDDFFFVVGEVMRATAEAYRKLDGNAVDTIKALEPALRAIDAQGSKKSYGDWMCFVREVAREAKAQANGAQPQPTQPSWQIPAPCNVNFSKPSERGQRCLRFFLGDEAADAVAKARSMPARQQTERERGWSR